MQPATAFSPCQVLNTELLQLVLCEITGHYIEIKTNAMTNVLPLRGLIPLSTLSLPPGDEHRVIERTHTLLVTLPSNILLLFKHSIK